MCWVSMFYCHLHEVAVLATSTRLSLFIFKWEVMNRTRRKDDVLVLSGVGLLNFVHMNFTSYFLPGLIRTEQYNLVSHVQYSRLSNARDMRPLSQFTKCFIRCIFLSCT